MLCSMWRTTQYSTQHWLSVGPRLPTTSCTMSLGTHLYFTAYCALKISSFGCCCVGSDRAAGVRGSRPSLDLKLFLVR